MTVSTIASLATGITRSLGNQNAKVTNSVRSLVAGKEINQPSTEVAQLTRAVLLQNQVAGLRTAGQNIAQGAALIGVAEGGAQQIRDALDRMKALSAKANNGTLSANDRQKLDTEFQELRGEIARLAKNTTFGGQKVIDGSREDAAEFAIGGLTDDDLFGGQNPNLLTADGAAKAYEAVQKATAKTDRVLGELGAYAEGLDFAAAAIEVAIQNQDAARAELGEDDIFGAAGTISQADARAQAITSLLAQTNKLPGNILGLLNE